jgi:multiple sugar transport system substrate-binding protein
MSMPPLLIRECLAGGPRAAAHRRAAGVAEAGAVAVPTLVRLAHTRAIAGGERLDSRGNHPYDIDNTGHTNFRQGGDEIAQAARHSGSPTAFVGVTGGRKGAQVEGGAMNGRIGSPAVTRRDAIKMAGALGMAATIGQSGVAAQGEGAPQGSIRYPIWIGQSDIAAWEEVVALFAEAVPEVQVQFEPYEFEQYWQKFNTQLAGGDVPAVAGMHVGLVYNYAENGQLLDLQELIDRDGFELDQIFENLIEEGRWPKEGESGLYMLPWRFVGSAFYVNKTLLQERGLPIPEAGWTWDDWLEIAQGARDESAGIWGSSLPANQLQQAQFAQAGAYGPLNEALTESNFLDPAIQEAVQFIADLALVHKVAPRPEEIPVAAGGAAQDMFLTGTVALHPSASWNIPAYREVAFEWDIVPQPEHHDKGAYSGPDSIAIPAASDNVEAAWAWIKFVTTDLGAQRVLGTTGIPVLSEYALSDEYIDPEVEKGPASYRILIEELTTLGRGYGFNASWFEWTRESNDLFERIYNGQIGVEEGLNQINDVVTEILNREQ